MLNLCQIFVITVLLQIANGNVLPSNNHYVAMESVCVISTTKIFELPSNLAEALSACQQKHNCYHVLAKISQNGGNKHYGVLQTSPKLYVANMPKSNCKLYSKYTAIHDMLSRGFTEMNLLPFEGNQNVQPMQKIPVEKTLKRCGFSCLTSPKCEFFRYNTTGCFHGSLSTFMISRAYAATGCKIYKKNQIWDNALLAYYSFNHTLANIYDRSRFNMEKVKSPVMSADGVKLSDGNYVRSQQKIVQLRDGYLKNNTDLIFVLRLKRSLPVGQHNSPGPENLVQWLSISSKGDADNFGLLLMENIPRKTLSLQALGLGTGFKLTSVAQLKALPYPNEEGWICASVHFSNSTAHWTVNGQRYDGVFSAQPDVATTAAHKWEMLSLAESGDLKTRLGLNGIVQSMAILSGIEMSEEQVLDMC